MMRVEDFSKNLFTTLAHKLIYETSLDVSEENGSTEEKLEYSDSNNDISRSILMLSYVYRPAFEDRFIEVFPILIRAKNNPNIYVRCFAEILHQKYSPLKFLILCSFISEIFRFLFNLRVLTTKRLYIQQTTDTLHAVFYHILVQDFPQNGWTDIKKEASKIARGFQFLEPFMNSCGTISHIADAVLTGNIEFQNRSQQILPHNESFTPTLVNIPETGVLLLSDESLPTNKIASFAQNQLHTTTFSFGTIDQDRQILLLVNCSTDQDGIVTFENKSSGMDPNLPKTDETTGSSHSESKAQEKLQARISEDETEPSFRTIRKTENGMDETCATYNAVILEQELTDGEKQFWDIFLATDSEDESGAILKISEKLENLGRANSEIFSEQELMNTEYQFGKDLLILSPRTGLAKDATGQYFQSLKENSVHTSETFSTKENVNDPENKTFLKEENVNDPENKTFLKEENVKDPENGLFSKEENVQDPENGLFPKEENVNDSKSETLVKENSLITGNVKISENQSEAFFKRQSNTPLKLFITNETVYSHKNDAQLANKIEINFQTNETDISAKILHLNLGGKNFVLRMPANLTLIFKYNGSLLSSLQPET